VRVNDLLKLNVADLALGGKGVARHDGRVVFVDGGLPGDQATVRVTRVKPSFVEARIESVDAPSPDRVPAVCPHVRRCGGCRHQEYRYEAQCAAKERQVRDTLERIGGLRGFTTRPIRPAPEPFHYRNKMEFSFAPGPDDGPMLGLHERGTFDKVFELETCLLPSELTVEIVHRTQRFAIDRRWRAYHPGRHTGTARFLMVRHLRGTSQCGVHLIAASDDLPGLAEWAREIAALSPEVRTVTLGINGSRSNVAFIEEEQVLVGDGVVVERLLGLEFEATANAFLQTNSRQAEALYTAAIEAAALEGDETVLDLYCGTGTLTLLFARAARAAIGVESVDDAVARAAANARRNGIDNASFVHGESRAILRQWARGERAGAPRPEVVVVDPPRAGLHPRVVARVAELAPRRIVYVSCNPATLARDAADFAAKGYPIAEVEPFDLFPHTPHIECVARLDRTNP
jgi:23S rRNA (uracil1939-C5)-methyltransferase